MKMNSGTAASVCSFIMPMVWKNARSKTIVPEAEVAEDEAEEEQGEADRKADEDHADHEEQHDEARESRCRSYLDRLGRA